MVQSLRGGALPFPRDDVVAELNELREGLREARHTGEGTHIKMPGVVRDALEAVRVAETTAEAQPVRRKFAPVAETPPVVEAPPVAEVPR